MKPLPPGRRSREITKKNNRWLASCLRVFVVLFLPPLAVVLTMQTPSLPAPRFQVDPTWPKPLPNHWLVGAVVGVDVDSHDHIWITHRPSTLQPNETRSFWKAAPPVLEFDQAGTLVSSWGGPGPGYEWPQLEHGIHVDDRDNVWLGAGGDKDAHIPDLTADRTVPMPVRQS